MAGITLTQAQTQLDLWLAADAAVAVGQSYDIGNRRLVRADAAEITSKLEYWSAKVQQLSNSASGRSRARTIVPRY